MNSRARGQLCFQIAISCAFTLLLVDAQSVDAQKVASYDYTDVRPGDRVRPPIPQPKVSNPERSSGGVPPVHAEPGVCGGILSNSPLVVSLVSLDRDSYVFGGEMNFVLQVRALYKTKVPIRASLAEIEPSDPKLSYTWRSMSISLEMRTPRYRSVVVGLVSLVGSKDLPGSEIELNEGEWIEIRGRTRMEWSNPPKSLLPANEQAFLLPTPPAKEIPFSATALTHRAGSNFYNAETRRETRLCDYPGEQSFGSNPVNVTVKPKPNP